MELYKTINEQKEGVRKYAPEELAIPEYITTNLKHSLFEWQTEALENLLYYNNPKSELKPSTGPTHLMFNMATGSGKTLLMAATMLYYYQQGYRHFLFFVNRNNIIDKTENNFIESAHTKYLFTPHIVIDGTPVTLRKVETFSDNPQGIEIQFTSIQKLYNDIHIEKENRTTLDDLNRKNIVMLADEAHHLNTDTSTQKAEELIHGEITGRTRTIEIERRGWEHTVIALILHKQRQSMENKNVLLEFTATIPNNESVQKKYEDKIVYSFPLKDFLNRGYTKEINLFSADLDKKERVLYALLFQWYRHTVALQHNIPNMKPVILFKSKTIAESRENHADFLRWIETLSADDFRFLHDMRDAIRKSPEHTHLHEQGVSRTKQILAHLKKESTAMAEIVKWIRDSYQKYNVIITDSKQSTDTKEKTDEQTEKLLNSLEDTDNHIRAIFTVNRLTEGWDVLNLFDIVRLYEGRDEGKATQSTGGKRKAGKATTEEKQLIGRGVRYCPFPYQETVKNKRRFDNDANHELRVLEELYFHSAADHRYISELKRELRESGYIVDNKKYANFALKGAFTKTDFYRGASVFRNDRIPNPNKTQHTIKSLQEDEKVFPYTVRSITIQEQQFDHEKETDKTLLYVGEGDRTPHVISCKDIERHIFRKAINRKAMQYPFFQYATLKQELGIDSVDELQGKILSDIKLKIITPKYYSLAKIRNQEWLKISEKFLDFIHAKLKRIINPYRGSDFEPTSFAEVFGTPKRKLIDTKATENSIVLDNDWYVLDTFAGTGEEENLIEFIKDNIGKLQRWYKEVYLLRNEEVYTMYDFDRGRGFQPDFLLFLVTNSNIVSHYQVFIEPKGAHIATSEQEKWKERFLEKISDKYADGISRTGANSGIIRAENADYRLIGLPFYTSSGTRESESAPAPEFAEAFDRWLIPPHPHK